MKIGPAMIALLVVAWPLTRASSAEPGRPENSPASPRATPAAPTAAPHAAPATAPTAAPTAAPTVEQQVHTFVRSDQGSKSRAPYNTADVTYIVSKEFQAPAAADAKKVIAHLTSMRTPFPVYLGRVHARRFATEAGYRENVIQLATLVTEATGVRCLVYFDDEALQHADRPAGARTVPASLAPDLQRLAKQATLALATACDARMTREQVRARVQDFHAYYGETLKIPLFQMFIDVNLAQPVDPKDLPNFDRVVGWALEDAYALHFGGFHTMGGAPLKKSTVKAPDSTYHALNEAWDRLAAAHPEQVFAGLRPQKR